MTLPYNKRYFFIILAIALIIGAIVAFNHYQKPIRKVTVYVDHYLYNDARELQKTADLIVLGTPEKDFLEYKPTITYNNYGRYEDFYTITDIKIIKTLKGENQSNIIPVLQGAALDKKEKILLIDEGYSVMEKDKKYLLFLKKTYLDGVYSIISVNQGKFNIDNMDTNENEILEKDAQYKKLKQDVLTKFNSSL